MVTPLPRIVVAAPATGQGKTTVATGLMAALRRAGHMVSGHKVGPDYIDPGYHSLACGRPGRNLDPHLVGEERIVPLLLHGASGADVAVVEGVMGLYDGRVGGEGFASTAHVATLTRSPVVLVVDASRSSRSVGAVVHGLATYDPDVQVAGVVLNKASSPRHAREVADSVRPPVLGVLPHDEAVSVPSRHLGLVPAAERGEVAAGLDRLAALIEEHIDLDAVLKVAGEAEPLEGHPWDPQKEVRAPADGGVRPVVAVAGGRAFTFRYTETDELLRAAGCDVVTFDPLVDTSLPEDCRGVYLGGGFPEVHAAALSDNSLLREDLRLAIESRVPVVAECAGLLYLCRTLDNAPMVGALPTAATMTERLTLRYPSATAPADSLLTRAGETVTGHEFHRTRATPETGEGTWSPAWTVEGVPIGFAGPSLHASYLHTHWAGHPHLAERFADAVHASRPHEPAAGGGATDPLRHHGDVEASPGLVDMAVNVYPGPWPAWLDRALRSGLEVSGRYPSATEAEGEVAQLHGVGPEQVLASAGSAEAFTLLARLRAWRRPVVVHPQFTEPHAALLRAGHDVTEVLCDGPDFRLEPTAVPDDADLVVVGNPTNPTGVLHAAREIRRLVRPGRLVVVDEAFMDFVAGRTESLVGAPGVVVLRSLTKLWGIPGVRAGYLVGDEEVVRQLRDAQVPWSVSSTAAAALIACTSVTAADDRLQRVEAVADWRHHLEKGLAEIDVPFVPADAPFVLARPGEGAHAFLRRSGVAVRRCDTFLGLDNTWVRIAVRPPEQSQVLLDLLAEHVDRC